MTIMTASWRPAEGGLERIAVEGGWIYRDLPSGGLCFVPAQPGAGAVRPRPQVVPAEDAKAAAA
jgi:hypothetical protein